MIAYPFTRPYPITDDFAAHLARTPPSLAPGLDFAAPPQTAILAPGKGNVALTPTTTAGGLGLWITLTTLPGDESPEKHTPAPIPPEGLGEDSPPKGKVSAPSPSPPPSSPFSPPSPPSSLPSPFPFFIYYCHLSSRAVVRYQSVSPGQVIAYTGNTGHTTGPHLHLAVKASGHYVDPMLYLARPPIPKQETQEEPIMPTVWQHTVSPRGHVEMEASGEQITLTAHEPASPTPSYLQAIREPAFNHAAIPRNPDAALLKYARRHGLGAPLTPEYHVTHLSVHYTCQGYAQAILICPTGDWANISEIAW